MLIRWVSALQAGGGGWGRRGQLGGGGDPGCFGARAEPRVGAEPQKL